MELSREFLDREFPSRRHGIQFNHAAVCPLPARATEALAGYGRKLGGRAALDWREWGAEADALRAAAARLIGAGDMVGGARSVSIVPNTTSGLNLIAQGLDLSAGASVVTTAAEFPANLTPWIALERGGVRVRRLPTRDGAFTAEELAGACDGTTRVVSVSLVSFHTGFRAPVEAVGAFCRARGILFGLDAIQGVGAIPVDVTSWGVDFLSADGHKWMLGPEGAGIFFCRRELIQSTHPVLIGWNSVARPHDFDHIDYTLRGDAARFECGSPNVPGLLGLKASIELLSSAGIDAIWQQVRSLTANLVQGLQDQGFTVASPRDEQEASGIVSFTRVGLDPAAVARRLKKEHRCELAVRAGRLRCSPHFYNTSGQIAQLLALLEQA
jgi:selenocysteine lyase/cysteine desulfurase